MNQSPLTSIAFYLPQFHPIPENDQWWGKGFTEWTKVAAARPLFPGHQQPHLPTDLGYYDLRVPETRLEQTQIARQYGIDGFCYYHYWFNGRRLLGRPLDDMLASGEPNFPFCICWANESWARNWHGLEKQVLLAQQYSREDDRAHMRFLARAFRDPRHIRVDGKPLFLVYRARHMPDPRQTADTWRREADAEGLPGVYLACVESWPEERGDPDAIGFDAAVEFAPDRLQLRRTWSDRLASWGARAWSIASLRGDNLARLFDYQTTVRRMREKPRDAYTLFPGVFPSWDNSPRRKRDQTIIRGATPRLFEDWIAGVTHELLTGRQPHKILFVNAWNEWAESCHLEPDQRYGRAWLEAFASGLARGKSAAQRNGACSPTTPKMSATPIS